MITVLIVAILLLAYWAVNKRERGVMPVNEDNYQENLMMKDLSSRWEINILTLMGYMFLSVRAFELFNIDTKWTLVLPSIYIGRFLLKSMFSEVHASSPPIVDSQLSAVKPVNVSEEISNRFRLENKGLISCSPWLVLLLVSLIFSLLSGFDLSKFIVVFFSENFALPGLSEKGSYALYLVIGCFWIIAQSINRWLGKVGCQVIFIFMIIAYVCSPYNSKKIPIDCELYKKARNWSEETFQSCKKHPYLQISSTKDEIAYTCKSFQKELNLDKGLLHRCKKSRRFSKALTNLKEVIEIEKESSEYAQYLHNGSISDYDGPTD